MERRQVMALLGGSLMSVSSGCIGMGSQTPEPTPEEVPYLDIVVYNEGDKAYNMSLRTELDDTQKTFGPQKVNAGTVWDVTTYKKRGKLLITVSIDENTVFQEDFRVPTRSQGFESSLNIRLQSNEEVTAKIGYED